MEPNSSVILRPLSPGDVPAVAALEAALFGAEAWSDGGILEELSCKTSLCLGAYSPDGALWGYLLGTQVLEDAHINTFGVAPARQGQGVGRALLAAFLERVKARGATAVTLEVRQGNRTAIGLYQAAGFEAAAVRKGFYRHPPEDGVIMRKEWNQDE